MADAYSYRNDPAVPAFPDDRPIVIFDGNCVLCSAFAQFILRTDRRRRFRLMAAQTRQVASRRPPSIAVHDDADMQFGGGIGFG